MICSGERTMSGRTGLSAWGDTFTRLWTDTFAFKGCQVGSVFLLFLVAAQVSGNDLWWLSITHTEKLKNKSVSWVQWSASSVIHRLLTSLLVCLTVSCVGGWDVWWILPFQQFFEPSRGGLVLSGLPLNLLHSSQRSCSDLTRLLVETK